MSFAEPTVVKTGENYFVSHGDDKSLWVEFYSEPVFLEFQSQKQGRPMYEDHDFVRIRTPGLGGNTVERRVRMEGDANVPSDPDRFPKQWQAYQNKQVQVQHGTPIEQWPPLRKGQVLELKAVGVHTVEQIAAISDTNLGVLGLDGRRLREMAKTYLDEAEKGAALSASLAREESLKADIEALKAQFAELAADNPKRGPGRPPKDQGH